MLVGHSMGVQVILETYRHAAARVAALVPMFGTAGEVATAFSSLPVVHEVADAALGLLLKSVGVVAPFVMPTLTWPSSVFLARVAGSNLSLCPPQYLRALMEHVRTMEPECIVRVFRSVLNYNGLEHLARIDVPALVFAGAADRLTPLAFAERMVRAIPRAELAVVDHGSHLAMLENPGFVHCRLELFLRDHGFMAAPRAAKEKKAEPAGAGASARP